MTQVKTGDVLWVMLGRKEGKRTIWQAESKVVVRVDPEHYGLFWLDNGWGASQSSLGKSYFRTQEEAEKDFEKGHHVTPLGNGRYRAHFARAACISCGRDGCKIG